MKNKNLTKGIILILLSALCTSFGQLLWKIGINSNLFILLIGFVLYGIGALSMIIALKFGELSILHPLMCTGYIFALINGYFFLKEKNFIDSIFRNCNYHNRSYFYSKRWN